MGYQESGGILGKKQYLVLWDTGGCPSRDGNAAGAHEKDAQERKVFKGTFSIKIPIKSLFLGMDQKPFTQDLQFSGKFGELSYFSLLLFSRKRSALTHGVLLLFPFSVLPHTPIFCSLVILPCISLLS